MGIIDIGSRRAKEVRRYLTSDRNKANSSIGAASRPKMPQNPHQYWSFTFM
jgi:hypothetical protein